MFDLSIYTTKYKYNYVSYIYTICYFKQAI